MNSVMENTSAIDFSTEQSCRQISTKQKVPINQRTITSLIKYIVLIPLLAPGGPEEMIPAYKTVMTAWSMLALFLLLFDSLLKILSNRQFVFPKVGFATYFVIAILVTLCSREGIGSGLQELFFYPVVFLYIIALNRDEVREYAVCTAMMLLLIFLIQLCFSATFFEKTFHLTFLGHVQVFSQYGLLAIFLSLVILRKKWARPVLGWSLLVSALASMLLADADSAHYSLVIVGVLLLVTGLFPSACRIDMRIITIIMLVISVATVYLTISRQSPFIGTEVDWTFSGRVFVWESCWELIQEAPLFGYGVENPPITVFWNNSATSYAHNQILQSLLDGGLVLCIAMVWLLLSISSSINDISDKGVRRVSIVVSTALLFVMVFDSFTPYSYIFMLFGFIAHEGLQEKEGTN